MKVKKAKQKLKEFNRNLSNNELVVWHGHPESDNKARNLILCILGIIIAMPFFVSNLNLDVMVPVILLFMAFFLFFAFVYYLTVVPGDRKRNRLYILTNKRAVILSKHLKGGKQQLHYVNMINLKFDNKWEINSLTFYKEGGQVKFSHINEMYLVEARILAVQEMFKRGAPAIVRSRLEKLSKKYRLKIINASSAKGWSTLEGDLGGFNVKLKITGGFPLENLKIELKNIPNPENNSFRIQAESQLNKVQKITKQDLEIGNKETDDAYLLESNDLYFLKTVLNDEVREELHIRPNELQSKIEFGSYQKSGKRKRIKTKFNADDQVLDSHLLEGTQVEIQNEVSLDPELKSTLILNLEINGKMHGEEMADQIEGDFELIQLLAQGINNYYER